MVDLTVLQYRCYYFHTTHKVDGKEFLSYINFEKCSVGSEIKLLRMRRRVTNAL